MSQKVAFVTGGTGGIGTAICRALSKDGYKVVAGYYGGGNHERAQAWQAEQKTAGYDIALAFGNAADYDSAQECIKALVAEHGIISVLVNNAGITRDGMFKKMSKENWSAVIQTNFDSVFNVTRPVYEGMLEQGWGRIINISSINGQKGQFGQVNYSAAKAGMHGFTKALAQECAAKGITVNTVSPGYVATEMVKAIKPEILASIVEGVPMKRLAEPEEIGECVRYLASDMAGYITGANVAINGGQHMF